MIILILVIALIIIIIFSFKKKNIENFDFFKIPIDFLDKKESCQIFVNNHNQYFSKMKYRESVIRGCLKSLNDFGKNIEKCKTHYCNNTMNFEKVEKQNLLLSIGIINNIYSKYFPKMLNIPWKLIKVNSDIEGGMPHTIENCIVISTKFLKYLDSLIMSNNKNQLIGDICTTLIHEHIHVYQRREYSIFKELYTKYWNFSLCNYKLKNKYLKNQRINPDGYDDWCFNDNNKNFFSFVSLKDNSVHLNDVETLAIPIRNNKIIYEDINKISERKEYNKFFCNVSQNYHPNEISAIILSEYIIDKFYNRKSKNCKALKIMMPWIKKNLE